MENEMIELYYGDWEKVDVEKDEKAFLATLAYEKNCQKIESNYINPQMVKIPKGETMSDYARKYGTTVKEMQKQMPHVECVLESQKELEKVKVNGIELKFEFTPCDLKFNPDDSNDTDWKPLKKNKKKKKDGNKRNNKIRRNS